MIIHRWLKLVGAIFYIAADADDTDIKGLGMVQIYKNNMNTNSRFF